MLENISVERVCSVFNHVVNKGGHNEISDCDFVAGDELAAATSKDSFDQFSVIKGSILETFQLLWLLFRRCEHYTSHATQDVAKGLND